MPMKNPETCHDLNFGGHGDYMNIDEQVEMCQDAPSSYAKLLNHQEQVQLVQILSQSQSSQSMHDQD